jgi:hypothetical protein
MIIENGTLAWLGLSGTLCDAMGGIYLTYDLLGGRTGPLGFFTRAATYSIIFGIGYSIPFGLFFGVVAGVGIGTTLGMEFWRLARYQRLYHSSPLYDLPLLGATRGLVMGAAAIVPFGLMFALRFGLIDAVFLYFVYAWRFSPTYDYGPNAKLRFSRHVFMAAVMRGLATGLAGALAGWMSPRPGHFLNFGLEVGLAVGLVSGFAGIVSPMIEWWIETLPEKALAVLGFALIFLGLVLQSVQYVTVLLG